MTEDDGFWGQHPNSYVVVMGVTLSYQQIWLEKRQLAGVGSTLENQSLEKYLVKKGTFFYWLKSGKKISALLVFYYKTQQPSAKESEFYRKRSIQWQNPQKKKKKKSGNILAILSPESDRDGHLTRFSLPVGKSGSRGGLAAAVGLERDDSLDFP